MAVKDAISRIKTMKSFLCIVLFYLCLSMLVVSCSENEPAPTCMQAEVVGPDNCQSGWYILKLEDDATLAGSQSNHYIGQLHGGYVTVRNLPEEYRQEGLQLKLSLELDEEPTQICPTVYVIYPAVRVVRVCGQES